jgi:hypothetical protein
MRDVAIQSSYPRVPALCAEEVKMSYRDEDWVVHNRTRHRVEECLRRPTTCLRDVVPGSATDRRHLFESDSLRAAEIEARSRIVHNIRGVAAGSLARIWLSWLFASPIAAREVLLWSLRR